MGNRPVIGHLGFLFEKECLVIYLVESTLHTNRFVGIWRVMARHDLGGVCGSVVETDVGRKLCFRSYPVGRGAFDGGESQPSGRSWLGHVLGGSL